MRIQGIGLGEFLSRLNASGYELTGTEDKKPTEREILALMAEHIAELRAELDELKAKQ